MIVTRKQACDFITESLNNDIELTDEKLEAVILAVNSDLQVRDWLMGMPNRWSLDEGIKLMQYLCTNSPSKDSVPFVTIQSVFYYELGETDKAITLLNYALRLDKEYDLAKLLNRVYLAGWEPESFKEMRDGLDHKVVEACYGEEGATTITEDGEVHHVNV